MPRSLTDIITWMTQRLPQLRISEFSFELRNIFLPLIYISSYFSSKPPFRVLFPNMESSFPNNASPTWWYSEKRNKTHRWYRPFFKNGDPTPQNYFHSNLNSIGRKVFKNPWLVSEWLFFRFYFSLILPFYQYNYLWTD